MNVSSPRRWLVLPRPTGWRLFVLLVVLSLGSEYWNKNPLSLGGVQVPWPLFILALLVLPFTVPRHEWRWTALLRVPGVLGPLLLFWVCCGLSIAGLALAPGGGDVREFLKTFLHLTAYVVFVYALVKWMTWARLALLVRAYYVLGIVAAALSILQFLHGTFGLFSWMSLLRLQSFEYQVGGGLTVGFRASSLFGEASWAARYFVHWIALGLAFWWRTRQRRHLAAVSLFVVAFYVANSLLGYAVLCAFLVAIAGAQLRRHDMFSLTQRQKIALAAGAYALLLLWGAGLTPRLPDLIDRSIARMELVLSDRGGAVSNRIDGVLAGLDVWRLAPVFGVGLGNIDRHIVRFYRDPEWVLRSQFASDSVYVQILAEGGLPAFLAFLWFWARLVTFPRIPWYSPPAGSTPALARSWMRFLQVDLLAQAVGMLNSADYLNPHLWTVVGIVLASRSLTLRQAAAEAMVITRERAPIGALRPVEGL